MAQRLIDTVTVTADTSPGRIDVPELRSDAGVLYLFEGDHSADLELLSDESDTDGLDIPSGQRWISGPHRAGSSRRMRWLYASSSTTATIHLIRASSETFQHRRADSIVEVDDSTAIDVRTTSPIDVDGVEHDRFEVDEGIPAGDHLSISFSEPGAERLSGQIQLSDSYDVDIEWREKSGNVVRTESVASGVSGGTWTDIDQTLKSAYFNVVITNDTASPQSLLATLHVR